MENAVDALKTAAAVLVFIIAITLAFTMFGKAKKTVDAITTAQDRQEYLESPDVDGGILYTSSSLIGTGTAIGMTANGDRIVGVDDVISTIYRYNLEKYGVTIVESDGTVLARFDSNTENIMRQWYNIPDTDANGESPKEQYILKLADNTRNNYANPSFVYANKDDNTLVDLYEIVVDGNNEIHCGAPWYGNESEINKRINVEISGGTYSLNNQDYTISNTERLQTLLEGREIIEVVNEIDNSKYLNDTIDGETSLLQEYQLPTIEVIYILR